MRSIATLAIALSMFSAPALAAQGEVCRSDAEPVPNLLTNATVFQCEAGGKGTIPELYAKGWRVVVVFPQMGLPKATAPMGVTEWVIVIEKL